MADLIRGDDGVKRCAWGASSPEYIPYHDNEWGRPVVDDVRLYEKLCLEGFQSGLSWLTILRKRDNFRRAFAEFDPHAVARFREKDIKRLLNDAGIVRHRGKIEATIANATGTLRAQQEFGSLAALIWSYEPRRRRVPKSYAEIPSKTPESIALSKHLLRLGFRFVGPTTVYAAMQSLGVVDDHMSGCQSRRPCEEARRKFSRPSSRMTQPGETRAGRR